MSLHRTLFVLFALWNLVGCTAPDLDDMHNRFEIFVENDLDAARAHFEEVIEQAEISLDIALPALEDTVLAEAIVSAWNRGVDVRVVTDFDHGSDDGLVAIQDAGIPFQLADAEMAYFDFGTNDDVSWNSEDTTMSHTFVTADQQEFAAASSLGGVGSGHRVVIVGHSEDIAEDLHIEHNQIFGGSDATALTAYSSPAKSVADFRWLYPSSAGVELELWFGPQERIIKRLIDDVYRSKSSIRLITNRFMDQALGRALERKAKNGFEVEVILGPDSIDSDHPLSNAFRDQTPNVSKWQLTSNAFVPTMMLVDYEPGRDGLFHAAKALWLTHDIISATRFYAGYEVETAQLTDGHLWSIKDTEVSPELAILKEFFDEAKNNAEPLL